ncbi:pyruvate formate lyase family protein [Marispirochaeta aestuarii]|uniref:glycyl radical protein n=1 Tax=Marispirochaeta aestuarii TaxID=1963862 RepID=UPI0029C7175B|nr:pyruvate formate lyase family protein [Marispirochaeta aestuarii]
MSYLDNPIRLQEVRSFYLERLLKPKLTSERADIVTSSYARTEGSHPITRRAQALKDILSRMSIYIKPWELLAGNLGPEPVSAPVFPEGGADFILEEMDSYGTRPGDKFEVSEETKKELRRILPLWKGKTLKEYGLSLMPEGPVRMREAGVFSAENMLTCGTGHFLPDYTKVLEQGFRGISEQAKAALMTLDLSREEGYEKRIFYEAVLTICTAVRDFSLRYAELADSMAAGEKEEERRRELKRIAEVCRRVPWEPAAGFAEAVQSLWFTHLVCYIDSNGYGVTLGRSASCLYPWYQSSIASGEIDREGALSLLVSLFFKTNDILKLYNNNAAQNYGGFPVGQPVQLGGIDAAGEDDTNELSFLFLEAEKKVKLYQPDIGFLWTEKIDPGFFRAATELVATNSKPKFFNYHVGSAMYRQAGLSEETAQKDWAFIGCVEYGVPGKTWTWADAAMFNLAKCLELALNDGIDPVSGSRLGPQTGSPEDFKDFSQFLSALQRQIAYMFDLTVQGITALQVAHKHCWPEPYESLLVDGCMQSGREVNQGGATSYHTGVQFVGFATVVDSLLAIKHFVFENRSISFRDLVDNLGENFRNNEVLRVRLLRETPRFGMDRDDINSLAGEVFTYCCDTAGRYRDIWGGLYTASLYSLTAHVGFGARVGATPDGRMAFSPLSDASSPSQGLQNGSVTEIFTTQAKLPHHKAINGTLLNMKLNKKLLSGPEGTARLQNLISTYFKMGGFHVQFNVVDVEVLKDAQANPDKYPDFLIRVAAYVTNWNQLSRDVQNEIISRAEMESF